MKDVENNSDIEKQNGIDDDSIISELRRAYKDIESKRNTAEFKKIKHAVEQKVLLKDKELKEKTQL